jgi:hypothetical protein
MATPSGFNLLLDIAPPFAIIKSIASQNNKRFDIWISDQPTLHTKASAEKTGWFGKKKQTAKSSAAVPDIDNYLVWRHLDVAGWKMYVHTPNPTPAAMKDEAWTGNPGQQFSNALSRIIFMMMGEGASLSLICSTLRLDLADLWAYKSALDKGLVGIQGQGVNLTRAQSAFNGVGQTQSSTSVVPGYEAPVWLNIANGSLNLDIKTLSLRLLLTKVKSQFTLALDDEVRSLHVRELHRYFERNQRALSHEIAQLT